MKKRRVVILGGLYVFCSLCTISMGQNLKIGFVSTLDVLYGTDEGKVELEELNRFGTAKQNELATEGAALQQLQERYTTQQTSLSVLTRAEMEREMQDRDIQLKRLQEDIQLEFNERQNQLLERMSGKIQEIINEYAPQNNFSVIFLRNEGQAFVDGALDITGAIVEIYNERNPIAGQGSSQ